MVIEDKKNGLEVFKIVLKPLKDLNHSGFHSQGKLVYPLFLACFHDRMKVTVTIFLTWLTKLEEVT